VIFRREHDLRKTPNAPDSCVRSVTMQKPLKGEEVGKKSVDSTSRQQCARIASQSVCKQAERKVRRGSVRR